MLASFGLALAAYLIGSISFAVVSSKLFGLPDPHSYGSGNPGATNVLRTGNKVAALVTLDRRRRKGWLAVWLAQRLAPGSAPPTAVPAQPSPCSSASLSGVPRLRGGKGVATGAGIVTALHWPLGLGLAALWLVMAFGFKISSLAALTAAVLMPIGAFWVFGNSLTAWAMVPIAVLLIWRHKANIRQLLEGKDRPIGR
jgi:glycerol-3-phosphate acyltransferase PlsY